ncbi:hypothetical protein V5799_025094 [Amblyomma americanum]|uniref:Secreted protein n=1 Tax=Amblyomma americanum TaxID=6943 RepID=A0AAQ4EAQ1_AMBAM
MRLAWLLLLALRALSAAAVPQRHELSNAIEDVSSASSVSAGSEEQPRGRQQQPRAPKDGAAVSRLLQVFGLREPRRRERHQQPPVYMLELYNATAGSGGITRSANKYNANLVRSFPDRGRCCSAHASSPSRGCVPRTRPTGDAIRKARCGSPESDHERLPARARLGHAEAHSVSPQRLRSSGKPRLDPWKL